MLLLWLLALPKWKHQIRFGVENDDDNVLSIDFQSVSDFQNWNIVRLKSYTVFYFAPAVAVRAKTAQITLFSHCARCQQPKYRRHRTVHFNSLLSHSPLASPTLAHFPHTQHNKLHFIRLWWIETYDTDLFLCLLRSIENANFITILITYFIIVLLMLYIAIVVQTASAHEPNNNNSNNATVSSRYE